MFDAVEHLFEENAFVGGVLIEENEAAIGFENDVELADDAEDAPALQAETDVRNSLYAAEALGETFDVQHGALG